MKDGETQDLTKRQKAILDFIVGTVRDRGFPPSVREICEAVGLSSPSTVHAHLGTLEQRGYLRRDPTKPRAIDVRSQSEGSSMPADPSARGLPVLGEIAAGAPLLAEQNYDSMLSVPTEFISDTPHFVLKVKGESMINAGILNGDYVVVKAQPDARSGDIVAAQMTGATGEPEATVKTLRRQGSRVLLIPENPEMAPIEAPDDTRILGKVVAVMRKL